MDTPHEPFEELEDEDEPAPEDGGCMYDHDHQAEPDMCEWHD